MTVIDQAHIYQEYIAQARQRAIEMQQEERRRVAAGEPPWSVYDTPMRRIESNLGTILGEPFDDFLARRREEKGKVFVMDVMGTGGFTEEYAVDGEIAITLVDFRSPQQQRLDKRRGKVVIADDVLNPDTWQRVHRYTRRRDRSQFPGIDLEVSRAYGGFVTVKESLSADHPLALFAEWMVVNNMVRSLSPSGGTLAIEMSGASDYDQWTSRIRRTNGLTAVSHNNFVKIAKTGRTFDRLPKIA